MKKTILTIIITIIVTSSITGVVAYNYNAKDVSYEPSDTNWNVNDVESAIKDLKNNLPNLSNSTITSSDDIIKGKKAYSSDGTLITGTRNNCISGDFICTTCNTSSGQLVKTFNFVGNEVAFLITGHSGGDSIDYYNKSYSSTMYQMGNGEFLTFVASDYIDLNKKLLAKNWNVDTNTRVHYVVCE